MAESRKSQARELRSAATSQSAARKRERPAASKPAKRKGGRSPSSRAALKLDGFVKWIVDRGLRGLPLDEQVEGFCRRVVDAGFPARRFNMSIGTLHPRHGARSYIWTPDGLVTGEYPRRRNAEERKAYLSSPIHHLRASGETRLRRRIDASASDDFPVLAELREAGMTDYVARLVRFEGDQGSLPSAPAMAPPNTPDAMQGIFFSCATDVPGGFSNAQLDQIGDLLPYLALAVKSRSTYDVAETLLETYLGSDAGRRVLTGEIDRHSVRRMRAVIWLCDLRGFSAVANRVRQEELVEILDAYLDLMARPVLDNGGQILKFLGDGFLATFDLSQRKKEAVCVDALRAASRLVETFPKFNAERRTAGRPTLDFGIALHLGEAVYGNIGAAERLDFTVVGSAVNEASRIEGMCRPLQRKVLASAAFHEAAVACGGNLVSVGFHALRGIREPQELFTLANA